MAERARNGWSLVYQDFVPDEEGQREALCTVGNGYFATRGAAPESAADDVHYPGTYAAGIYNRLTDGVNGQSVENESLVNLPNWLPLTFRVEGGPWFSLASVDLLEYRQELDMRRGVLTRVARFTDPEGHTTGLTQRRFAHMEFQHLCGLQTTITAEDWSGRIEIRSALDGTVENTGVERYRKLASCHLSTLRAEQAGEDTVLLVSETSQSGIRIGVAARTRLFHGDRPIHVHRNLISEPGLIGQELVLDMSQGEAVCIDKVAALYTTRDNAVSEPARAAELALARAGDFDELLERHARAWGRLWQRAKVELNDGDDQTQSILRLHMYHVLQTLSRHSVDLDAGVPARGLHGEAYRGHVLWDELFVFPILNFRFPLVTHSLLLYRYRRMAEARQAAREEGLAGAMFPWQSASDGREETQRIHLNPISGRWVPDTSHRQRHIGIAIAYNVWQFYQATGDVAFLSYYGAEMLVEIARFWASIATYDHSRDRYVIRGVMGPDEFHTGYPDAPGGGVDNNAYTNIMATWVLLRALEVLALLPEQRRTELTSELALGPEEIGHWEDLSRKLYVPFHGDGVISQFEDYENLAELDWDGYRRKYGSIRRLDRILEAEHDSPNRYKASKQADVLMLFYLLSADELLEVLQHLGYRWDPQLIPRTIDYYLARTSDGSTLSTVVHTWVLARAHRPQAVQYFIDSLKSDVADIQGGTTAEGIHLAAMAGPVDVLQRCFAGVEVRGDTLWLNPYWPIELGTLEFTMRYRGHVLTLYVTGRQVRVAAGLGVPTPITIRCRDVTTELGPGESVNLPFPGGG